VREQLSDTPARDIPFRFSPSVIATEHIDYPGTLTFADGTWR